MLPDDLVVATEFGDTIFPGLVSTGKVERGGNAPYHKSSTMRTTTS
ncbi:hypothetical protein WJ970_36620 [Achromobacter xylosoxidans]